MKKIILLVIALSMFVILDVKAAYLTINGMKCDTTKDVIGDGFKYYSLDNILELNNYNGKGISTNGELNIIVRGDNYINGANYLLRAESLTIYGDGVLNIMSSGTAIYGKYINIKGIKMNVTCEHDFLQGFRVEIGDCNIKVNAKKKFLSVNESIIINNSNLDVKTDWGILYPYNHSMQVKNSKFLMECGYSCFQSQGLLYFDDSIVSISSLNDSLTYNDILQENDDNKVGVSYDGINYDNGPLVVGHRYLKIVPLSQSVEDEVYTKGDILVSPVDNDKEEVLENYTDSEYAEVNNVIDNPKTDDDIYIYLLVFLVSILSIFFIVMKWIKKYESN